MEDRPGTTRERTGSWSRRRLRILAVARVSIAFALAGCASGAGLTLFGAGAGVAAGTGVDYTLNGIAYKTFTAPVDDVHTAMLLTLKRMGMKIKKDKPVKHGYEMQASAVEREIYIDLETVTKVTTRMRVDVDKGDFFKDRATASEIILQAANTLDREVATQ